MYTRPTEGTKGKFEFNSANNRSNPQISPQNTLLNQSGFDFNNHITTQLNFGDRKLALINQQSASSKQKMFIPGNYQNQSRDETD